MLRKLRGYLMMGFIVLLPTIVTLYVVQLLFVFIDRMLGHFITNVLVTAGLLRRVDGNVYLFGISFDDRIPGLGFILVLLILLLVGLATTRASGKDAIRHTERFFKKIPVARTVYSTIQQITTTLMQDRSSFKKVVLVEYPRKGIYTMGFLTGSSQGEVQAKTEKECLNVFLPTTPNPTSGWLIIVPKDEVLILDLTVEQGLKYIISGGVVVPRTQKYPILQGNEEEDIDGILERLQMRTNLAPEMRVNIQHKHRNANSRKRKLPE